MTVATLYFGVDGGRRIVFRPLTGADERICDGDVHLLLERMALPGQGVAGDALIHMTVGDRDRAFSALYVMLYGADIIADATCTGCGKPFELRFNLEALTQARSPDGRASGDPPTVKIGKSVYRLPLVSDLSGDPGDLLIRLHHDGPKAPEEEVETAIEAADPALALDLAGTCPECGKDQQTPFSMAGFLASAIRRDAAFLMREIHMIARSYSWDFDTILALTRSERQGFVRLILGEAESRSRVRSLAS